MRNCILLFLGILFVQPTSAQEDMGTWITRPVLPTPRQEMPHVAYNGEVYVLGGINTDRSSSEVVEVYNTATGTWTEKAPLPPTLHHQGAAVANGKIYVLGGYITGFDPTDRVFEYDPATDSWDEKSPMPLKRGAAVAVTIDGKIYVIGGERLGGAVANNQVYDPATDTWQELAPMPTAREHLAAAVVNGKIYVIGGRQRVGFSLNNLNTVESYDPATDTWDTSLANLPQSSGGLAAASLHGRIYAFGGEFFEEGDSGIVNLAAEYDPEQNTWRNIAPMPIPRHGIGAVAVADTIFIIGGGPQAGYATTNMNSGFVPSKPIGTTVDEGASLPQDIAIFPNYPNPFQTSTTLSFTLPAALSVRLTIYDLLGREISVLIRGTKEAGTHRVEWDASALPDGVYVGRLEAGDHVTSRLLIKKAGRY